MLFGKCVLDRPTNEMLEIFYTSQQKTSTSHLNNSSSPTFNKFLYGVAYCGVYKRSKTATIENNVNWV